MITKSGFDLSLFTQKNVMKKKIEKNTNEKKTRTRLHNPLSFMQQKKLKNRRNNKHHGQSGIDQNDFEIWTAYRQ